MSELLQSIATKIGHSFHEISKLEQALTHKSFANEQSGGQPTVDFDNERLEFLGDAVLDLALSDLLMTHFPTDPEGSLSKKRASLVNEESLAKLARELGLDQALRLGKGEAKTGGLQKPRLLASSFEAVLGAVYLDGNYVSAKSVVERVFGESLKQFNYSDVDFVSDFKTRLQERIQEARKSTPTYHVESEQGPDHDKIFEVSVRLGDEILAKGQGRSKKAAEQDAARKALEQMNEVTQ